MVESTPGTEATKVLNSSGTTPPAGASRPPVSGKSKLIPGTRWRDYQIESLMGEPGCNRVLATHVGRMEKVVIFATLLNKATATRRAIWELLSTKLPVGVRIVPCLEAYEEEGWRYEITGEPPPTTLREWIACHQAEDWMQRQLLEQLSATLAALHTLGIVQLNIRPENIYLNGDGAKMDIVLGGLDSAALYKQASTAATDADPFYAPPEAVDPEGAKPGIGLCAWDWWSVGRVLQEVILGRHVMTMLFGTDVIRNPSPEVRERARQLLREVEPPGMRAGAVESMPELPLAMKSMLRGLLTSARDARWGADAVTQWLAKESVTNHYDLARDARFFTWKGRGRTLSDAAQYFRREENWSDGELNFYDSSNLETLANFLSTVSTHAADWKRLQEFHAAVVEPGWADQPEAARRSFVAAIGWHAFGPQPGAVVLKGRRIDPSGLVELLAAPADSGNFDIVRVMLTPTAANLLGTADPGASETLRQLAAFGGKALQQLTERKWVEESDQGTLAHVLKLSLEPEAALRKRGERVRTSYAACRDAELSAMLTEKAPSLLSHLILAVTAENPRRHGFVTRAEHARNEAARLRTRAAELQVALFWLHLKGMLVSGRPWSGLWTTFAWFWLSVIAFGLFASRDVTTTALTALAVVTLRWILGWRIRVLAARCDPAVRPSWTWRDGPERCLAEARRFAVDVELTVDALNRELTGIEARAVAFAPDEAKAVVIPSRHLAGLWPVFVAAGLVGVVASVQLLKNLGHTVGLDSLAIAMSSPNEATPETGGGAFVSDTPEQIEALLKTLPGLAPEMADKIRRGEYEIVKEAFGSTIHGPIKQWAFSPPAVVPPLPVESRAPATAAQRAFALVSGELLLRPYGRKGVTALFVVRVPTADGFGLMVYNAKARKLVDNQALTLREGLPENTWYRFERYNVIYLGAPTQMDARSSGVLSQR